MTKKEAKEHWGKMVRSDKAISRHSKYIDKNETVKTWDVPKKPYKTSVSGLLIGTRTLFNGSMSFDSEYGWLFSYKDHIEAALIVPNFRAKPVPVLLESVYLLEEENDQKTKI